MPVSQDQGRELARTSTADVAFYADPAQRRAAEQAACESPDPWIRSAGWAARWLGSYRRDSTREQYRHVWHSLVAYGQSINTAPIVMERRDIEVWMRNLETHGNPAARSPIPLGPASVARHVAAASSYYRYCEESGAIERVPVPKRNRPKPPAESPHQYLAPEQVRAIVRVADDHGAQSAALVALLLCCLRVSEAVAANVEDLSESGGHRVLTVIRKGGKRQKIPLPPPEYRRILAAIGDRTSGPIVATRSELAMDRHAAWKRIRLLARRASIPGKVSPHTFRHASLTYALSRGVPLHVAQQWAGHEDARTTEGYWRQKDNLDNSPAYVVAAGYYDDQGES